MQQEEERRRAQASYPALLLGTQRVEALTNLFCNTYCSKMEEREGAREVGRQQSEKVSLLGVKGFILKSRPHPRGHWNSSACH